MDSATKERQAAVSASHSVIAVMETMQVPDETEFRKRTEEIVERIAALRSKYTTSLDTEIDAEHSYTPPIQAMTRRVVERDLARDTVLFRGMDARNLFDVLAKKLSNHNITVGMGQRFLNVFRDHSTFTYGDFLDYDAQLRNVKSCVRLRDFIRAEISITNIRASSLATTFDELLRLGFRPSDLRVYSMCSLAQLVQLYNVGWRDLLRVFSIGPYTYLVDLNLSLQDIGSFDLSIETMINWTEEAGAYCRGLGHSLDAIDPKNRTSEPLTAKMIRERPTKDSATDWHLFCNLEYHHFSLLGIDTAFVREHWRIRDDRQLKRIFDIEEDEEETISDSRFSTKYGFW